jgi:8-hydroxy-5-deazaflavin:NADPH oxidoreductase
MQIGVFGTGAVGRAIAAALVKKGHRVMIGTRDPASTLGREAGSERGSVSFKQWHADHPAVRLGTFSDAARFGEVLVNATSGSGALPALDAAGPESLGDSILLDIANPLDFSKGFPPSLSVCNTDSLAEQIQRRFPRVRVVKTLNTTNASVMVDPASVGGGDHTLFMSGNDAAAKAQVKQWLEEWFGWRDVIDLGDITTARGSEMLLPLWVRLWGALGSPTFNFKIVR